MYDYSGLCERQREQKASNYIDKRIELDFRLIEIKLRERTRRFLW